MSWMHWDLSERQQEIFHFTKQMIQLRKDHPVFRRRRFFQGASDRGGSSDVGDIAWLRNDGSFMEDGDWGTWFARSVMVFFNGGKISESDLRGQQILDDDFILAINASSEDIAFTVPDIGEGADWALELSTAGSDQTFGELSAGDTFTVVAHSFVILSRDQVSSSAVTTLVSDAAKSHAANETGETD